MRWLKNWLGLTSPLEKKKKELSSMRTQAMHAQRNGDLRTYASLTHKIEALEDEIVEMIEANPGT